MTFCGYRCAPVPRARDPVMESVATAGISDAPRALRALAPAATGADVISPSASVTDTSTPSTHESPSLMDVLPRLMDVGVLDRGAALSLAGASRQALHVVVAEAARVRHASGIASAHLTAATALGHGPIQALLLAEKARPLECGGSCGAVLGAWPHTPGDVGAGADHGVDARPWHACGRCMTVACDTCARGGAFRFCAACRACACRQCAAAPDGESESAAADSAWMQCTHCTVGTCRRCGTCTTCATALCPACADVCGTCGATVCAACVSAGRAPVTRCAACGSTHCAACLNACAVCADAWCCGCDNVTRECDHCGRARCDAEACVAAARLTACAREGCCTVRCSAGVCNAAAGFTRCPGCHKVYCSSSRSFEGWFSCVVGAAFSTCAHCKSQLCGDCSYAPDSVAGSGPAALVTCSTCSTTWCSADACVAAANLTRCAGPGCSAAWCNARAPWHDPARTCIDVAGPVHCTACGSTFCARCVAVEGSDSEDHDGHRCSCRRRLHLPVVST